MPQLERSHPPRNIRFPTKIVFVGAGYDGSLTHVEMTDARSLTRRREQIRDDRSVTDCSPNEKPPRDRRAARAVTGRPTVVPRSPERSRHAILGVDEGSTSVADHEPLAFRYSYGLFTL